jgi:hypothetical protein
MMPGDPEDIVEEQANVEEVVEAIFEPSEFNTFYAVVASKSLEKARFLDENPLIRKAINKFLIGCRIFAQERGLRPDEIDADYKMTTEGRVVITLRRAW